MLSSMRLKKKRPRKARIDFAKNKARKYLIKNKLTKPPINVKKLLRNYGEIIWTKNIPNGFTIYYEPRKVYGIFINPDSVEGRVNWTLCHELAHILLGHFIDFDMDNLTHSEEKILDRECDIFVREFLMPKEWFFEFYEPPITVPQLGKLKDVFGVSWKSLKYRFSELGVCSVEHIRQLYRDWRAEKDTYSEVRVLLNIPNFCNNEQERRDVLLSIPIKIPETDVQNRYTECPKCTNKIFSHYAKFCKMCGFYLYNECLNIRPIDYYDDCGSTNVGNALFCEYCGSRTMLYEHMEKIGLAEDRMREIAATSEANAPKPTIMDEDWVPPF